MPTYQYACSDCGHDFEAFQSFSDDALTECPACHGRLRKVFNSVGIVFKGSGFYRNDSREKAGKGTSAPTSESSSGTSKDAGSKGSGSKDSASTASTSTSGSSSTSSSSASSSSSSGSAA